jgi:hypothetical protein
MEASRSFCNTEFAPHVKERNIPIIYAERRRLKLWKSSSEVKMPPVTSAMENWALAM